MAGKSARQGEGIGMVLALVVGSRFASGGWGWLNGLFAGKPCSYRYGVERFLAGAGLAGESSLAVGISVVRDTAIASKPAPTGE